VVDSIIGDDPAPGWVTSIFGSSVGGLIALAVVATLLLTALAGGLEVWNEYLSTTVDQRMVLDFRSDMFEHAQKLSLAFHDKESTGILMYRINDQAAAMGQIVTAIPAVAQSLLTLIGMAYISVRINPLLALLALGATPAVVLAARSWSIVPTPTVLVAGVPTTVSVAVTNTGGAGGGDEMTCVRVTVPTSFTVTGASIVSVRGQLVGPAVSAWQVVWPDSSLVVFKNPADNYPLVGSTAPVDRAVFTITGVAAVPGSMS